MVVDDIVVAAVALVTIPDGEIRKDRKCGEQVAHELKRVETVVQTLELLEAYSCGRPVVVYDTRPRQRVAKRL